MSVPWWAWVLVAITAVVWWGLRSARAWRAQVRRELVAYLAEQAPEMKVAEEHERHLVLRDADGTETTANLHRLFGELSGLKPDTVEGRRAAYARFVAGLAEQRQALAIEPERDRARLRPRLLPARDVEAMARQAGTALPALDFGVPGLQAVLVLDAPNSVRYVDTAALADLGVTAAEGLAIAVENLRQGFSDEPVRQALESGVLAVVKTLDSYDAARLLLLPGTLREGERLVAMIPDRDTLTVLKEPPDPDDAGLRRLARNAAGEPLWREPLLVTAAGIQPLPVATRRTE